MVRKKKFFFFFEVPWHEWPASGGRLLILIGINKTRFFENNKKNQNIYTMHCGWASSLEVITLLHMCTHLRVLGESYPINTSMTGFRWFSKDCVLVIWTKVASALEGLRCYADGWCLGLSWFPLLFLIFRQGPLEGEPFVDDYISTQEQVSHLYSLFYSLLESRPVGCLAPRAITDIKKLFLWLSKERFSVCQIDLIWIWFHSILSLFKCQILVVR